jgi:aspartyl/glutamyl-tRNA(Asn/Gln) amidotransferase C subunit
MPNPADGPITAEVFAHLVRLAQFELTEQERDYLRSELNGQLKAIRQLEAMEIGDELPITSHGVPYGPAIRPPIRQDEITGSPLADEILEGAPQILDRYLVVPDIPHEELE